MMKISFYQRVTTAGRAVNSVKRDDNSRWKNFEVINLRVDIFESESIYYLNQHFFGNQSKSGLVEKMII